MESGDRNGLESVIGFSGIRTQHGDSALQLVKEAMIAAGLGEFRLHDLHHTFASIPEKE